MSPMLKKVEKAGISGIKQKRKPYKIYPDDFFNNVGHAFVLKPKNLRYFPIVIPPAKPLPESKKFISREAVAGEGSDFAVKFNI